MSEITNKYNTNKSDEDIISRQLDVFLNPLSDATGTPKIPDGAATLSTGLVNICSGELTFSDDTAELLFYPHYSFPLSWNGLTNPDWQQGYMGWENGIKYSQKTKLENGVTKPAEPLAPINGEHSWRYVSAQVKLTSVSEATTLDGWWEAIRFKTNRKYLYNLLRTNIPARPNLPGSWERVPLINNNTFNTMLNDLGSLTINPTYCTGKMKDLHRYNFQLLPYNNNPFNVIDDSPQNSGAIRANAIDPSFDCILIRFHGQAQAADATTNTPELRTKLMVHATCNQEVIYGYASKNGRFNHESYDAKPRLAAVKKKLLQNTKAAKPMYKGGV